MQQPLELPEVARREQRQMVLHEPERLGSQRGRLGQCLQLQRKAFGGVARAHARRLHVLQVLERDRQLVRVELELLGQQLQQLSSEVVDNRHVERVDQRGDDLADAQRHVEQGELGNEVIAQELVATCCGTVPSSSSPPRSPGSSRRRPR